MLQRAILDHASIRPEADVDIILTKWDLVQAAGRESEKHALALVKELAAAVAHNHDAASFITCGRSLANPNVATGAGLDFLVKRWTRQKHPPVFGPVEVQSEDQASARLGAEEAVA
jgi:hypothetical protein